MKLSSIEFKNFASYGNRVQRIDFNDNEGMLYLIVGENGSGKCLCDDTVIDIIFDDPEQEKRFKAFLEKRKPF